MARRTGLDPVTGARLGRLIGGRDLWSGAAIALATSPGAARRALQVRTAFDALDAAVLGTLSPLPRGRRTVAVAAATWGAAAALLARRNGAAGGARG